MTIDAVLSHIDDNLANATERLMEMLKIPSISTDPAYAGHCQVAADWLVADLRSIGINAEKRATAGHPMVVGNTGGKGRHLLFYGHYDVQPVDPVDLWSHDPFQPFVEDTPKGQIIRGRGASDDKGQLMTFVEACRAWKAVNGSLPNITFLFEGEEESGSPSLVPFLQDNADELRAEIALICDTSLFGDETPAITTMLRGLVGENITVTGPVRDLHSGLFGGPSMNPIRALTAILGRLHDENGRVTVPGFYDGVSELPPEIKAQWDNLDFDPAQFLGNVGLKEPAGERGRSMLEQLWARPTCEINGIWGGYTGDGFKTVLPGKASAKVSFRLVGGQDPQKVRANFRQMIRDALPVDCSVTFHDHGAGAASQMSVDDPAFEAARMALSQEWPRPAAYIGSGGSIPIAGHFQTILGMDSMLIGFGKDDDQIHSPNEKYDMSSFHRGMRSWARILDAVAG